MARLLVFTVVLILTGVLSGCETRSKSEIEARTAYEAGEKAAYARIAAAQRTSVVVIGQVQNPEVQWKDGLTLAQAIVASGYTGRKPREIILLRQGVETQVQPEDLLYGHDVPLQPGDTITIHE